MELKDNCCICHSNMLRKPVVRLQPCRHKLHEKCADSLPAVLDLQAEGMVETEVHKCPICREIIRNRNMVERNNYKRYTDQDRERIVRSANKGEDWVALCKQLNISYKTAYNWTKSGHNKPLPKGGKKPKILNEQHINEIIDWIEEKCDLTLREIRGRLIERFNISVSVTMNSAENKMKRAEYVRNLNSFIEQGKQIIWMDETNFNLFCRRNRGRAKSGQRAIQVLPASRGPNVHLIGAISAAGVVVMTRQRGNSKCRGGGFTATMARYG